VSVEEMVAALSASSLGEVSWVDAGVPRVRGVVPLVRGGRPALAFTYADESVARAVAAAPLVTVSITEPRSTGGAFRPLLMTGPPSLVEDPDGEVYGADLLVQELHRYPPSRIFADSPLLQREHWWYLPRLIVDIEVAAMWPLAARTSGEHHLLVVAEDGTPVVHVARVLQAGPERIEVVAEGDIPAGPAVLFGQDASFPDLERWSQWRYRGHWDGAALRVEESPAHTGLGPAPGLMQRWRHQRELQRRCVTAIPGPGRGGRRR